MKFVKSMSFFQNLFTLKNHQIVMTTKKPQTCDFPPFQLKSFSRKKFNRLFILSHVFSKCFLVFNKEQAIGHRESLLSFTDSFGYSSFEIKVYSQLLLLLRPQETFSKEETLLLLWYFFSTKAFLHRAIRYFYHNTLNFVPLLLL